MSCEDEGPKELIMRRQRAGLRSARRSQPSDVKSGAMACPFVLTALGVMWLLASQSDGQVREPASQQERIIDAIGEMMQHTQRVRGNNPDVADLALEADRHLRWLLNNAKRWVPATAGEGSALRESLERMTTALRDVAQDTNTVKLRWEAIRDDLAEKVAYCRQHGLAATRQVRVVTKRNGTTEIKGMEVLYVEKFFASDANAKPLQFRGFSSPAVDELAPGRYLFWAKEPGAGGKSGERKEARVGVTSTGEAIEVLVP
jgi:hypothetical protein